MIAPSAPLRSLDHNVGRHSKVDLQLEAHPARWVWKWGILWRFLLTQAKSAAILPLLVVWAIACMSPRHTADHSISMHWQVMLEKSLCALIVMHPAVRSTRKGHVDRQLGMDRPQPFYAPLPFLFGLFIHPLCRCFWPSPPLQLAAPQNSYGTDAVELCTCHLSL